MKKIKLWILLLCKSVQEIHVQPLEPIPLAMVEISIINSCEAIRLDIVFIFLLTSFFEEKCVWSKVIVIFIK